MSPKGLRVEFKVPSRRKANAAPAAPVKDPVPRIARLLALAHKWEGMVRRGEVRDYAEIARRAGLSRARVSQVCKLVLLRPKLQEQILTLSNYATHAPEVHLKRIVWSPDWEQQKRT